MGDTVLVLIDPGQRRPLLVTRVHRDGDLRVSGLLHCDVTDMGAALLRGGADRPNDPAQVHAHQHIHLPIYACTALREGSAIGEWIPRPSPPSSLR